MQQYDIATKVLMERAADRLPSFGCMPCPPSNFCSLTALTMLAGLNDSTLARQLVERRRDLMIQSAAYEIIKKEGFNEGIQQEQITSGRKTIYDVLEVRFEIVPLDLIQEIKHIDDVQVLEALHRKAVTVKDLPTFRRILHQILEPERES